MFQFWLGFGLLLILAEMLLPGLVAVFVGMGALTVAALMHFHIVNGLIAQLLVWFFSSTVYIFTLRLLVMKYYPTDIEKQNVDEDQMIVGRIALVTETIPEGGLGRISCGETTWKARSETDEAIPEGRKVKIKRRENITYFVELFEQGEN